MEKLFLAISLLLQQINQERYFPFLCGHLTAPLKADLNVQPMRNNQESMLVLSTRSRPGYHYNNNYNVCNVLTSAIIIYKMYIEYIVSSRIQRKSVSLGLEPRVIFLQTQYNHFCRKRAGGLHTLQVQIPEHESPSSLTSFFHDLTCFCVIQVL